MNKNAYFVEDKNMPTTKTTAPVKYLTTVRLSKKGRIVLPKKYRTGQKLEAGSPIRLLSIGSGLLLLPKIGKFNRLCEKIENTLKGEKITENQMLATLPDSRRELFEEIYPNISIENETEENQKT